MRKALKSLIVIILLLTALCTLTACPADKEPDFFTLKYSVTEGGNIEGETSQTIEKSKDGLEVTAVPNQGYEFIKWSDNNTNQTRQEKNVQKDIVLTAIFSKIEEVCLQVNYTAGEGGYIDGEESQSVLYGQSADIVRAVENMGYTFVAWSDGVLTAERTDENLTAGLSVTATFAKIQEPVYVKATYKAGTGGTIIGTDVQDVEYNKNTETVTAKPDDGYTFVRWSDGKLTAERIDKNIMSDFIVTAIFAKIQEPILMRVEYIAGKGGIISGTEVQNIEYGQSTQKVKAVADTGYEFVKWSDDVTTAERTDKNVWTEFTVTAIFTKTQEIVYLHIEYLAGDGGTVNDTTAVTQNVEYGKNAAKVTATPNNGYEFVKWSDNVTTAERTDENVTAEFAITAIFSKIQEIVYLHIEYLAGEGGTVNDTATVTQNVEYGKNALKVTAITKLGYKFVEWSDGESSAERTDENITTGFTVTAIFTKIQHVYVQVKYVAGTGGYIDGGDAVQDVLYGQNTDTVTAVPNINYEFIKWSDGVLTAERTDEVITLVLNVTAIFRKITRTFTYVYNSATDNNDQESVELRIDKYSDTVLIIPQKEYFIFDGWYLDSEFNIQVSDECGSIVIGDEIFGDKLLYLYAKWTAEEEIVFKILMVYVTEIDAILYTGGGIEKHINYALSDLELQICELISLMLEKTLNEMFDGLVTFVVDSYFTKEIVGNESMSGTKGDCYMFANDIVEVGPMLKNYRSVITSFSLNDYTFFDECLWIGGGIAGMKYASINLEARFMSYLLNDIPLERLLDLTYPGWNSVMSGYIHEFAHTVEQGLDVYEFHAVLAYYNHGASGVPQLEVYKLYLLNQAEVYGEKVGIPYSFWKGDFVWVNYVPNVIDGRSGGTIKLIEITEGKEQVDEAYYSTKMPYGGNVTIMAIAKQGYRFVKWSDGVETATREDINIISYLTVTAIFEKI